MANNREYVHRTGRGVDQVKEWYFLRRTEKAYHAVGRTSSYDSITPQGDIDDLAESMGYINEISDMSRTQQIDFMATEYLRKDRADYLESEGERHIDRNYPYLSPWQWMERARREVTFPDIEALKVLMDSPRFRRRDMPHRVTRLPFDRQGNQPYVWTRSPTRVGRDPDFEPRGRMGRVSS